MRKFYSLLVSAVLLTLPALSVAQSTYLARVFVKDSGKILLVDEMFFVSDSQMWTFYTSSVESGVVLQSSDNVIILTPVGYVDCNKDSIFLEAADDSPYGVVATPSEGTVNFTLFNRKNE